MKHARSSFEKIILELKLTNKSIFHVFISSIFDIWFIVFISIMGVPKFVSFFLSRSAIANATNTPTFLISSRIKRPEIASPTNRTRIISQCFPEEVETMPFCLFCYLSSRATFLPKLFSAVSYTKVKIGDTFSLTLPH